jgi:hypothetical protein
VLPDGCDCPGSNPLPHGESLGAQG